MPKYVIWCEGDPPSTGGLLAVPKEQGFLISMRGERKPIVDNQHPNVGMPLGDLATAKTMFDALEQPGARLLAILE